MAHLDAIDGVNAVDGTGLTTHGAGRAGKYALARHPRRQRHDLHLGADRHPQQQHQRVGHAISNNLTINASGRDHVGLIGIMNGAVASVSTRRMPARSSPAATGQPAAIDR